MWNSATHLLTKPHYRPKQHVNPQLKHCRVLASYIGKSVVLVLVTVSPHSELTRLHFINSSVWNYHVEQWAYGRVFRFVDLFCFWGLSITGCCHKVTHTRHTLDKVLDMLKQVDILVCLFVFPFFNKVFVAVVIRHINDQENVNIAVFCAGGAQFEGTSGSLYILQPNPEAWSRSFHEGCQGSWCIRYVSPFI